MRLHIIGHVPFLLLLVSSLAVSTLANDSAAPSGLLTGAGVVSHRIPPVPDGPPEMNGHSMVEYQGLLYIYGGCTEKGRCSDELFVFDPKYQFTGEKRNRRKRAWAIRYPAPDSVVPSAREGHAAAVAGNVMYLYGGSSARGTLGDFYALDLRTVRHPPDIIL